MAAGNSFDMPTRLWLLISEPAANLVLEIQWCSKTVDTGYLRGQRQYCTRM